MKNSKIEWTDDTLNALRGCSRVSEGCVNCYAELMTARFSGPGQWGEGLATYKNGKPRWTGKVTFHPEKLDAAIRVRKPRKYFVNSISDLFHENVPTEWIDQHFAAFALAPQHIFQILTKRPERMREYLSNPNGLLSHVILPNVWLGVSAEDQKTADERIPILLDTRAAVRWISAEPLLGAVDLSDYLQSWTTKTFKEMFGNSHLDWVVVGGESGTNARPCNIEWLEKIVTDCDQFDIPVFVKQMGVGMKHEEGMRYQKYKGANWDYRDKKGGDINEFPPQLKVQEYPYIDKTPLVGVK